MKSMYRDFGNSLIDPKYCCVAVPLVNAGIYAILLEQFVVSLAVGIMVFATPSVVGAWFPSFAGIILALCCFVVAILQPVGFIGVLREKTKTYRYYTLLNMIAVLASFATAAGLIISSAIGHNPAVAQCQIDYFTASRTPTGITAGAANSTLSAQADVLCPAFAWADVGIMGGIWLLLLLTQGYFVYATRKYGTSQVSDHKLYHSVYSENPEAFTMSVLRSSRYNPGSVYNAQPPMARGPAGDDAWDHRPSTESLRDDKLYPSASGAAVGGGAGGGNRDSAYRYDDAAEAEHGYGQHHQHHSDGYNYGSQYPQQQYDSSYDAPQHQHQQQHQHQGYGFTQEGQGYTGSAQQGQGQGQYGYGR